MLINQKQNFALVIAQIFLAIWAQPLFADQTQEISDPGCNVIYQVPDSFREGARSEPSNRQFWNGPGELVVICRSAMQSQEIPVSSPYCIRDVTSQELTCFDAKHITSRISSHG